MAAIIRKIISTTKGPKPVGPYKYVKITFFDFVIPFVFKNYCSCLRFNTVDKTKIFSQAVVLDRTLFVSGVLGMDVSTNKLVDGGAVEEARQALKNIGAILEEADSSYEKVVKTTILLNDIADFGAVNEVYKECMGRVRKQNG